MSKCECYAILNREKGKEFLDIFPDGHVPISSPIVQGKFTHPTVNEPKKFHLVAIERLTKEQRAKIVDFIAKKFGYDKDFVDKNLEKEGLPLRDEIIDGVAWCSLHTRCIL